MTLQFKYNKDDKTKKLLKNILITSSYCETLGFKNGEWEFNFNAETNDMSDFLYFTHLIIDNYMFLGGPNIDISSFNASDDTILTLAVVDGVINNNYRKGFNNYRNLIFQDKRASGINTITILDFIKNNPDKKIPYTDNAGGNGAAIRTAPIGILFSNINDIISHSFINSIETHNQVLGFMGGIATAVITFFAKEKIKPTKWFDELIKLDKNKVIEDILDKMNYENKDKYIKNKFTFWDKIKDYNEFRKTKILKKKYEKIHDRFNYLLRLLRPNYKNSKFVHLGASGLEIIILSFEAILLSYDEKIDTIDFNKLVFYGILHFGDNDSTGSVVGAWYSAYHNIVPPNIKPLQLEFIKDINSLVDKL